MIPIITKEIVEIGVIAVFATLIVAGLPIDAINQFVGYDVTNEVGVFMTTVFFYSGKKIILH